MLMSLSQRYVFLANKRAASTSFEAAYGDSCEIASGNNRSGGRHPTTDDSGKHVGYQAFLENYDRFFNKFLPVECFFVFGVVREPMRRLQSLYRNRLGRAARRGLHGADSFAQFVDNIVNASPASGQIRVPSQHSFFMDRHEEISLNYLVRMEDMQSSLEKLREVSGLDFLKVVSRRQNAASLAATPIDPGLWRVVEEQFARDYDLYELSADRLLREWDRSGELDVDQALRWMAQGANRFEIAGSLLYKVRLRLQNDKSFSISELVERIDRAGPDEEAAMEDLG